MLKYTKFLIIGLATLFQLHSVEPYWLDFYEMAASREEALAVPLDSTDSRELKRSAMYFHATVNGLDHVKPETRRRKKSDNSEKSIQYITAVYNLDKSNTMIASWMAIMTCSHTDAVIGLFPGKIQILKSGIEIFKSIPHEERQNLDFLFMQTIIYSAIPSFIEDLTNEVIDNVDTWFLIFNRTEDLPVWHISRQEDMKVFKAKAFWDSGNRSKAKELISGIKSHRLSTENSTMSIDTLSIYKKLATRLRIK